MTSSMRGPRSLFRCASTLGLGAALAALASLAAPAASLPLAPAVQPTAAAPAPAPALEGSLSTPTATAQVLDTGQQQRIRLHRTLVSGRELRHDGARGSLCSGHLSVHDAAGWGAGGLDD